MTKPLTKGQLLMAEDGVPLHLFLDEETRKAARAPLFGPTTTAWINGNQTNGTEPDMMSITTNTRGSTQMPKEKDYADMNSAELAAAYNKISGKPPIKKFKDKATALKRLAEATTEKAKAPKAPAAAANGKAPAKTGRLGEFGFRADSPREKFLKALLEGYNGQVPVATLAQAAFGSKTADSIGRLGSMVAGVLWRIKESKLAYELRKEGKASIGLYPAK